MDIQRVVTTGSMVLDGEVRALDNNVWLLSDGDDVLVVDASHDAEAVAAAAGDRRVVAIVLTHGHRDHVNAAPALADALRAPLWLHPADAFLWEATHPDLPAPTTTLPAGQRLRVGGSEVEIRHTPGHTPGSSVVVAPGVQDTGAVMTGDTLFPGGPGATRWEYSSFPTIVDSISTQLLTLAPGTVVHPGHGDSTTIGAEAPHRQEWIDRGW